MKIGRIFLDQCYDYLAFYDVLPKKTKEIGLYCGNKLPSEIRSQTNVMSIHFFSDGTVTKRGFNLTFSAQCKSVHVVTMLHCVQF